MARLRRTRRTNVGPERESAELKAGDTSGPAGFGRGLVQRPKDTLSNWSCQPSSREDLVYAPLACMAVGGKRRPLVSGNLRRIALDIADAFSQSFRYFGDSSNSHHVH